MKYPTRATFLQVSYDENAYGEQEETESTLVTIGTRVRTERFRDQLQGQISLDGDRQYVYARKTAKTLQVKQGDKVSFGLGSKNYKVIAIDSMLNNRSEIMFLIDALS